MRARNAIPILAAASLAVLAVVALLLQLRGGKEGGVGPSPSGAQGVAEPRATQAVREIEAPPETRREAPEAAAPSRTAAEPDPGAVATPEPPGKTGYAGRIAGHCVDGSGSHLEGVRVECPGGETHSDSAGRFELELPLGEDLHRSFHLRLTHPGHGSLGQEVVVRADETTDLGELVLLATGTVAGRVVDAQGGAFPGAEVRLEEALRVVHGSRFAGPDHALATQEADAEGAFRIEDVPVGQVRVWAGAADMLWDCSNPVTVHEGEEISGIELEVVPLEDEDTIDLLVVDPDGEPVPRAEIHYRYRTGFVSGSGSMTADENGRCRRFLDVRASTSLVASDPEDRYRPASAEEVPPGTHDLVLRLLPYESFDLRVEGPTGDPMEGFRVRVAGTDRVPYQSGEREARILEAGLVELVKPTFPFTVTVEAEGYALEELGTFDPATMPDRLTARLTPLPAVRGRITGLGEPLSGARVSMHRAVAPDGRLVVNGFPCRSERSEEASGTSGDEGAYELTLREAGAYFVRAEAPGFAPDDRGPFELDPGAGAAGLDVDLGRGGTLRGRVLLHPGEEPSGRIVGVSRADGFGFTQRTDAEGAYRFEGLAPGRWLVEWRQDEISSRSTTSSTSTGEDEGAVEMPWSCEVREGRTTTFDLDLRNLRLANLNGRFALSDRTPKGWEATLSPSSSPGAPGRSRPSSVDSAGRFQITTPEVGPYELWLRGMVDDTSFAWVRDQVDLAFGDNEWVFDEPAGALEGHVAADLVGEGSSVDLTWKGGGERLFGARIIPTPDGDFSLSFVPAGEAKIRYSSSEGRSGEVTAEVREGQVARVDLP